MKYSYVLITPARNEEAFIEKTIKSVISQTVLPTRWVIVSDGSTDRTDEIVKGYSARNSWIELLRMPEHGDRQFADKVYCFNAGYERVKDLPFDFIGNLDADLSFKEDYFEFILSKFVEYPELGVAGTPFVEGSSHYDYRFTSINHVSGACQMFRRECFEAIGGYTPIKGGGEDVVAVTTARMKDWMTRTFTEKSCCHHREMGTASSSSTMKWFTVGTTDYLLGGHPLWEVSRGLYQMSQRPYFIRGALVLLGYLSATIRRVERPVSQDFMQFVRAEQMQRLQNIFRRS